MWGVRCQYAIETYPPEMKGIHDACWNICHVGDDVAFSLYERLKLREESGVKFCLRFSFYYKMFCHDENVLSCWCLCKVTDFSKKITSKKAKNSRMMLFSDSTKPNQLFLYINRQPVVEWFKEQWNNLRLHLSPQRKGLRL